MVGMYPLCGSSTEVVHLHTLDTTYDYIIANPRYVFASHRHTHNNNMYFRLCPKYLEYLLEFHSSSVWHDHQNVTECVLNAINEAVNFTVGEDGTHLQKRQSPEIVCLSADKTGLLRFSDCLRTYHCHGLPWPEGMTDELYNMAWEEVSWQHFNQFAYPSVPEMTQVSIGFLLKEIWQVGWYETNS